MDNKILSERHTADALGAPAANKIRREGSKEPRFEDRRPASALQRKVQAMADANSGSSRLAFFSDMAEKSAPPARIGNGVVQGYFSKRQAAGGLGRFMPIKASQPDLDAVYEYLDRNKARALEDKFVDLSASDKDEGTLEDWVEKNTGTTIEKIKVLAQIPHLKAKYPQIGSIPEDWFAATNTSNGDGPPITVMPSWIPSSDFLGPPIEPGRRPPNSLVIDLSKPTFNYTPPGGKAPIPYPISEETGQHVMSGAMLENSYLDFRASKHMSPLVARSTSDISVKASELTRREREKHPEFYPSKETVVGHRPDKVWTGAPHSEMGFQPITNHANTLGGDMHKLGEKVRTKATLSGVVVRHEDGREYRPTLESFHRQREWEESMDEFYREIDKMDDDRSDGIIGLMRKHKSTEIVSKMTGVPEDEIEEIVAAGGLEEDGDGAWEDW